MEMSLGLRMTLNCNFCGQELDKPVDYADGDDVEDFAALTEGPSFRLIDLRTRLRCPKCWKESRGMNEILPIWIKYKEHREAYEKKTGHFSMVKTEDEDYRAIVAMGQPVVKFILLDLLFKDYWDAYPALSEITGENPITEEIAGRIPLMSQAWVDWGYEQELI